MIPLYVLHILILRIDIEFNLVENEGHGEQAKLRQNAGYLYGLFEEMGSSTSQKGGSDACYI